MIDIDKALLPQEVDYYTNTACILYSQSLQDILKKATENGKNITLRKFHNAQRMAHYKTIRKLNNKNYNITNLGDILK